MQTPVIQVIISQLSVVCCATASSVLPSCDTDRRQSLSYPKLHGLQSMLTALCNLMQRNLCARVVRICECPERETLHLFQPPRADQMPDPHQGQCYNIHPDIL